MIILAGTAVPSDDLGTRLSRIVLADADRRWLVGTVAELGLPDCWVAAGFVRNAVWDHLHGHPTPTPLNDVDVIYFDPADTRRERDTKIEAAITARNPGMTISVKNQARMHTRNGDLPYRSATDAMRYWPETCTAIGIAQRGGAPETEVTAPFGLGDLFALKVRPTSRDPRICELAEQRTERRGWLRRWPRLTVADALPDSLLITGPPASGKSTVRAAVVDRCRRTPETQNLGIDDVLREMVAEGTLSGADAQIGDDGALYLRDIDSTVPSALDRLYDRWRRYPFHAVIEAPVHDRYFARLAGDPPLLRRTAMIWLDAPLECRVRRNTERARERISETGLRAMPSSLAPRLLARLHDGAAVFRVIDSSQSWSATWTECGELLAATGLPQV